MVFSHRQEVVQAQQAQQLAYRLGGLCQAQVATRRTQVPMCRQEQLRASAVDFL
jgi:hypothetical protein